MIIKHKGQPFEVTRTSADSATVNLHCGAHEHRDFITGLMEDDTGGWVVGRKEAGYPHKGRFASAVEHAADLLVEECLAMGQVDTFFEESREQE